jgi:hypothetical protein
MILLHTYTFESSTSGQEYTNFILGSRNMNREAMSNSQQNAYSAHKLSVNRKMKNKDIKQ